ncbi:hypothetical protein L7F22_026578 [Adiantum nelumboides]|nr:hypothetical protein [Adiantum nelumboides]
MAKPTFPKPNKVTIKTPTQKSQPIDDSPNAPPKPKKRNQLTWTEQTMEKALQARENGLSLHKCSLQFGMSRTAISNWEEGRTQTKKKGLPTQLSIEEEDALLQWIYLKCESRHGVFVLDVKFKVAEICQMSHTLFSNEIPGKIWWDCFRKRHPKLVFRVSEGLDQSRATRFRPEIVESLHDNL